MLFAELRWRLVGECPGLREIAQFAFPCSLRRSKSAFGRVGAGLTEFRYKAFVSYSWADAAWGKWLHHAIETYRTPKALIGKETASGTVPARLIPLFKDREEEAAGSSIGGAVEAALGASEFLIVICSPRSAQSEWVNREVAWFKTHRDPSKVLALIVDGEPGSAEAECFPKALTHHIGDDLAITDIAGDAPLAADARSSGDGKRRARLKLAAAMLGVGLDELVNRDDRRRTLRARIITGASLALALVMSGMAWVAVQARIEADHQRSEADGLVEFMLTDLRKKLQPVGRLDALDAVGQRALKYYAGQKPSSLDPDALGRRSRALHLVGEVRDLRGDSEQALNAFRQASAATGELLARDPTNGQRIFDHAQSVYWVGDIAYRRGQRKEAEAAFREYKHYADQLAAIDPKNPDWQMEVSYAESNLGTLLLDQGRYAEAERAFTNALQVVERASRDSPGDVPKLVDLGQAMGWVSYTLERQERIEPGLASLRREASIYEEILAKDPGNTTAKSSNATAWAGIGKLETMRGRGPEALKAFQTSIGISQRLRAAEPANSLWRQHEVKIRYSYGTAALLFGNKTESWRQLGIARDMLAGLVAKDPTNDIWNIDLTAQLGELEARLLAADHRYTEALQRATAASTLLQKRTDMADPAMRAVQGWVLLLGGEMHARLGHRAEARTAWLASDEAISGEDSRLPSSLLTLRYVASKRLGDAQRSRRLRSMLDERGWQHPLYRQEARVNS